MPEYNDWESFKRATGKSAAGEVLTIQNDGSISPDPAGDGPAVGFAWHWYFGVDGLIIADGDHWSSTDAPPTIDHDPQGFFVVDGAIIPAGFGGSFIAEVVAGFTSGAATGIVTIEAIGNSSALPCPVWSGDSSTRMNALWHRILGLDEDSNDFDIQVFRNLSGHDVTLLRVDVRLHRIGAMVS